MSDYKTEIIEKIRIEIIPQISLGCPKFTANASLHLDRNIAQKINISPEFDLVKIQNDFIDFIDFYDGDLPGILKRFNIRSHDVEITRALQLIVAQYLSYSVGQHVIHKMENLKKRLQEIEKTVQKLKDLMQPDITNGVIFFGLLSSDATTLSKNRQLLKSSDSFEENFLSSKSARLYSDLTSYLQLEETFKTSMFGEWIQYGKSGRKENKAVDAFLDSLTAFWFVDLGRGYSYPENKNSGREQFLNFADTCFRYVHPKLNEESDVIRNAFEKLRTRGKFDYLENFTE